MIQKGIGKTYIHALHCTPKISVTKLGEIIVSKHGVTQGRSSSANYYSFYVSDVADSLHHLTINEYSDPYCLAQLADDTAIFAGRIDTLKEKLIKVFNYSDKNYQVINIDKTKYVHLYVKPRVETIAINKDK